METMHEIAQSAIAQIPLQCRFTEEHGRLIHSYKELLLSLEDELVQIFYDTLYNHPTTGAIFVDGERPARELTLSHWWRRTVNGPINDQYWAWMATVGLIHVARRVTNPMMLTMGNYVASLIADKVATIEMNRTDADHLVEAFRRLASTVGALISYGYDRAYDQAVLKALDELAGMPESLFARLREAEITAAVAQARAETQRN